MPPDTKRWGYAEIADELERRINGGILGVGMLMPGEQTLASEFGVARNTVRRALDVLRDRGLIKTQDGRGTFVRPPVPTRRIGLDRYRKDLEVAEQATYPPPAAPDDPALAGHLPTVEITEVAADATLAALFAIPEGTRLSRRYLVHRIAGQPVQLTTSYFPLELVQGTWVATPTSEPCPGGTVGQLYSLGVRVADVEQEIVLRHPTGEEAQTLRLDGDRVAAITRRMFDGDGRVVEVAREIVIPSEGLILEYRITL